MGSLFRSRGRLIDRGIGLIGRGEGSISGRGVRSISKYGEIGGSSIMSPTSRGWSIIGRSISSIGRDGGIGGSSIMSPTGRGWSIGEGTRRWSISKRCVRGEGLWGCVGRGSASEVSIEEVAEEEVVDGGDGKGCEGTKEIDVGYRVEEM